MAAAARFGRAERYRDRAEAGRVLAEQLTSLRGRPGLVILALPRGGIPVAAPIAATLQAPLAVLVVRKLGAPGRPELAVGAVAVIGDRIETVRNAEVTQAIGLSDARFADIREREVAGLTERTARFGSPPPLPGRSVVVVDDGLATGSTMLAALAVLRTQQPAEVVVAVPVASHSAVRAVRAVADDVVCPATPEPFMAVGQAYVDFGQVSDEEVLRLLAETANRSAAG